MSSLLDGRGIYVHGEKKDGCVTDEQQVVDAAMVVSDGSSGVSQKSGPICYQVRYREGYSHLLRLLIHASTASTKTLRHGLTYLSPCLTKSTSTLTSSAVI